MKMSVAASPLGEITVPITLPSMTNAHSAAMACQCSSRMPPGLRRMDTPAMCSEMGNSVIVASKAEPASPIQRPELFSTLNLNGGIGSCWPGSLPT